MRVVADSHAIVWYVQRSTRLSKRAAAALSQAEASDGIVVSVATLVDLW
jgi:PIN domain nuclease of toxin-antitoxin system